MTKAKKKRSNKAADAEPAPKRAKRQQAKEKKPEKLNGADSEEKLDSLPDNVLLRIFIKAGYKGRLTAMQVCKHFKAVATHPMFTRTVKRGQAIMEVVKQARAGDTIVVPPGLYDEMVLCEKPLKMKGGFGAKINGERRRGVVLQSSRSICVMCNARCCFENMVFRSSIATGNRSIASFGASCDYMRFDNCEFSGLNGLCLPKALARTTKLVILGCHIHSVSTPLCAVAMETGFLRMEGSTITSCYCGIDAVHGSAIYVKNNDISFNDSAINLEGRGVISDNIVWGNVNQHAFAVTNDVSGEDEEPPSMEELLELHAKGDGEEPSAEAEGHGESGGGKPAPKCFIRNNHIRAAGRKRERTESEAAVRKRIRQLAVATYGQHEHEGAWPGGMGLDDGNWTDEEDDFDDFDDMDGFDEFDEDDGWDDMPPLPAEMLPGGGQHFGAAGPNGGPNAPPIVLSDSDSDSDSDDIGSEDSSTDDSDSDSDSSDSDSEDDGWDSDDGPMPPWAGGPMPLDGWEAGMGDGGDHSDDESSLNDALAIEEQAEAVPEESAESPFNPADSE